MSGQIAEVNKDSPLPEIEKTKQEAGACVQVCEVEERQVQAQQQQAQAAEASQKPQAATQTASHDASKQASAHFAGEKSSTTSFKPEGSNRFSVGCDVACEAAGVGALTQGVSMVSKLWTEGWNPAKAGAGQRTMEDLTSGKKALADGGEIGGDLFGGGKKSKGSRCIGGGTPAGLSERSECFNLFAQNPGKPGGARGLGKNTAKLTKEVQHAKLACEKKLGQANKAACEVGTQVHKLQMAGLGQSAAKQIVGQLNKSLDKNLENGPKAPDLTQKVAEETTESWA